MVRIHVEGMTCSACTSSVEKALLAVDGVTRASVSLSLCEAEVEYDRRRVGEHTILEAVEDTGFDAKMLGTVDNTLAVLEVKGMTCSACTSSVEKALQKVCHPGRSFPMSVCTQACSSCPSPEGSECQLLCTDPRGAVCFCEPSSGES